MEYVYRHSLDGYLDIPQMELVIKHSPDGVVRIRQLRALCLLDLLGGVSYVLGRHWRSVALFSVCKKIIMFLFLLDGVNN